MEAQRRQNIHKQFTAESSVKVEEEFCDGIKTAWFKDTRNSGCIDLIQYQLIDRMFTEILSNFRTGIIGTKCLLVYIFFKDITKDIRVYLIVPAAWNIIEIPRVTAKELKYIFKGLVRDMNILVITLNPVWEEEAAIEILDVA